MKKVLLFALALVGAIASPVPLHAQSNTKKVYYCQMLEFPVPRIADITIPGEDVTLKMWQMTARKVTIQNGDTTYSENPEMIYIERSLMVKVPGKGEVNIGELFTTLPRPFFIEANPVVFDNGMWRPVKEGDLEPKKRFLAKDIPAKQVFLLVYHFGDEQMWSRQKDSPYSFSPQPQTSQYQQQPVRQYQYQTQPASNGGIPLPKKIN